MFSAFFISRARFAMVISLVIIIAGVIAIRVLPVAQFPDIVPPQVSVQGFYPGANSEIVAETVAAPIEAEVNGVDDMLYMTSTSDNSGRYRLDVTFAVGTDPDIAAVNVQNRVALALPTLPNEVTQQGVSVRKQSTNMLLTVNLLSPNGTFDRLFLSNYMEINIRDALARLPGVGDASQFGPLDYAMRIWLDPQRMTALGVSEAEVVAAIRRQNLQAAAGRLGAPPDNEERAFTYTLQAKGRLTEPQEFERILVRTNPDGSVIRLADLARLELGAQTYDADAWIDGVPTAALGIYLSPGANALETADRVYATLERLAERFPDDLEYDIYYDTTDFVRISMRNVVITLLQALSLVILVTYAFLGDWRATLVPVLAIPGSIIGTFAVLLAAGLSINTVSMFAVILAIGIVVDDAIVVVENTQRLIDEERLSARDAARRAMQQVTGPIVATTLVLYAVFVPTAFLPGITGQLYLQFAVTISVAVTLSSLIALTLSPALCGLLLRPSRAPRGPLRWFFAFLDWSRNGYARLVAALGRRAVLAVLLIAAAAAGTGWLFNQVPTGFIPSEDTGYFFIDVSLPDASSIARTGAVLEQVQQTLAAEEEIEHVLTVAGFSLLAGVRSSGGLAIAVLKHWDERPGPQSTADAVLARVQPRLLSIPQATVFAFAAPPIQGLGTAGGIEMELLDLAGRPPDELAGALQGFLINANADPGIQRAFSTFSARTPQLFLDIDREKAETLGVRLSDLFVTLQANLGSLYVNDFNLFGRTFRVFLQADGPFRMTPEDLNRLHVRNARGEMVPMQSLVTVEPVLGPESTRRFNMFRAASVNVTPLGSTGEGITVLRAIERNDLPPGFAVDWSGTTFQEVQAGGEAAVVLMLALLFVYLFLVAQYESWTVPTAVILSVVIAGLGGLAATWLVGLDNNVYTQIGLVMLIGLASKNAILIVEFAKQLREEGRSIQRAASDAARIRYRAVLMTAVSFILGMLPLVLATGAGAASQLSLGVVVLGGMLAATFIGIILIPPLYVFVQGVRERVKGSGASIPQARQ
ncbi:MAG: multidrug efflux RND transporter permease subunit [Thiocapsa sp.]|jgi:hydrophobe/amphiphile efflux-1 (HAE1) family protein|nr:multidrug efflux RND transporter permease subunit [Thiocapsa sp.]MCG6897919.1 multidrug efflux RND transporter permease subunit [Thiocapsa sp.]MCG6984039.1 multidrug efflux RND transporter permease subunit [Thiocapsa sp.]